MGLFVPIILHLVKFWFIGFVLILRGSEGYSISPSPAIVSDIPTIEGARSPVYQKWPIGSTAPSSGSKTNGSNSNPPVASPPLISAPVPQTITGLVPSHSSSVPVVTSPSNNAAPPLISQGHVPSSSPGLPFVSPSYNGAPPPLSVQGIPPVLPDDTGKQAPVGKPLPDVPAAAPLQSSQPNSSVVHPGTPKNSPPSTVPPPTALRSSPPHSSFIQPGTPENSPPSAVPPPTPLQISPPHSSVTRPSTPENSPPSTVPPPAPLHSSPQHLPVILPRAPENSPPSTVPPSTPLQSSPPHSSVTHPSAPENSPSSPSLRSPPPHSLVPHPSTPESLPPNADNRSSPGNGFTAPNPIHSALGPAVSPIIELPKNKPENHHIKPRESPLTVPGPNISHDSIPPPKVEHLRDGTPNHPSSDKSSQPVPPVIHSPAKAPSAPKDIRPSNDAPVPYARSQNKELQTPPPLPSPTINKYNHGRREINGHAPVPVYPVSPPSSKKGLVIPPSILPAKRHTYRGPLHLSPGSSPPSPSHRPFPKPGSSDPIAPSTSPESTSIWNQVPILSPKASQLQPLSMSPPRMPPLLPIHALPPPPPNEDCLSTVCAEPYTNTPPGSPCGCVLPMQVGMSVNVALYTFFPFVSEFAQEIATGVFMELSQVRIMGANAASPQPEKTIVLIDLVPLGEKFDNTTAFLTYHRFWHKEVFINPAFFGDYEVLYVRYPGLPQSPPLPPSTMSIIGNVPYPGDENNGRTIKPLGVDINRRHHKDRLGNGMIALISLSAVGAVILFSVVAWLLVSWRRNHVSETVPPLQSQPPSITKPSVTTGSMIGSGMSSASFSFESSIAPYTGSAKTFTIAEIERATNKFDASRILGEGGFGRVYSGMLEDGTEVAVKVLKRDDHQGGREFLAEVEMLSRLHHRNLVRLIGICVEEHARCLVYELIPNGNVESYLHGAHKDSAPLDWDARLKIALGAARGLAYLHEDSSPRVIHRDFKSSNILLEHDFIPKVSDFGLARTALDEQNCHISTRVMGTFGYVAPEYAMTGHLLVKSDVYSYGVVLLELLTGRKPVDMTRPPGQENLVAWACPLLTCKEGLEMIIDPTLGHDIPFDSVAKVAAIASMCVQPEVSNRPFMGEVVQALKLVCTECDEAKQIGSRTSSRELSIDMDAQCSPGSAHHVYDSDPDIERGLPISDFYSSTSVPHRGSTSQSIRRCSSLGPSNTRRTKRLLLRMKALTGGSASEHGIIYRLWSGLQ